MIFNKYEKVIINKGTLKGKLGTVLLDARTQVKVKIDGDVFWFKRNMLRPTRFVGSLSIEEGPVIIKDIKGNYQARSIIGKSGEAKITENIVKIGDLYLELGDVVPVPKQKLAWVCLPSTIRRLLIKYATLTTTGVIWIDEANYQYSDKIVFDSLTEALDFQRPRINKNIIQVRWK